MVWKNGRCFSKLFGGGKRYNKKFLAIWPEGNCFVYISYKGVNIGINLSFVFLFVFVFVFWKLGHETWSSARMYQVVSEAKWCNWWRSQPKMIFRRILVRRLFSGELFSRDYFQEESYKVKGEMDNLKDRLSGDRENFDEKTNLPKLERWGATSVVTRHSLPSWSTDISGQPEGWRNIIRGFPRFSIFY